MDQVEYFLEEFAKIYPYSHCVWRIGEAVGQLAFLPFLGPCLDLGCGDGSYMQIMLGRLGRPTDPTNGSASKLYGLDPQNKEISRAQKLGIYDQLMVGFSNAIPLPDASVNMVFSNSVVEHIPDKEGTIREVARILKPGGRYVFSAPSEHFSDSLGLTRWLGKFWPNLINWKFKHHWMQSPDEWGDDLSRYGLKLINWKYTLTEENLAEWERYLLPSYIQHLPAKAWGWVPGKGLSLHALRKRKDRLVEAELKSGGNLIICAEKSSI